MISASGLILSVRIHIYMVDRLCNKMFSNFLFQLSTLLIVINQINNSSGCNVHIYSFSVSDATSEYIEGNWDDDDDDATRTTAVEKKTSNIPISKPHHHGLRCCTVLIGGFLRSSGVPIFAAVSQPFSTMKGGPTSTYFCAHSISNLRNLPVQYDIVLSSAEDPEIYERLKKAFTITVASGAGYKIMMVAWGWCKAYINTKSTTFRWDTCGPDALLRSLGGAIRQFKSNSLLQYNVMDKYDACNSQGLIAYRNETIYHKILNLLEMN